jgi:hypothetical protein
LNGLDVLDTVIAVMRDHSASEFQCQCNRAFSSSRKYEGISEHIQYFGWRTIFFLGEHRLKDLPTVSLSSGLGYKPAPEAFISIHEALPRSGSGVDVSFTTKPRPRDVPPEFSIEATMSLYIDYAAVQEQGCRELSNFASALCQHDARFKTCFNHSSQLCV